MKGRWLSHPDRLPGEVERQEDESHQGDQPMRDRVRIGGGLGSPGAPAMLLDAEQNLRWNVMEDTDTQFCRPAAR